MSFSRDKALSAAQQFAARGELDKAIREYQSVVEHDPKDVQTWLMLADSLHRAGELDAAIDRYAHAANVLLEQGEIPNALQIFRQVLNLAPERYDIHLRTGQAFEQLRRYPEAVALYEKVAGVYLRSGNTREALMLYERVADLMPREVAKRLRLAELFSRERRVEEAIQHFQLGADFLRQAGRAQEYVRVAERLLYHRPLDGVTRELVRVYLEIDQPRRALMKLNELLQRSQSDAEGLELLAETFVRLDKADKAASVVLELVKTQRHQGPAGVARCFKALRKALGWTPHNPQLRKVLDELTAEHGPDVAEPSPTPQPIAEELDDEVEEFEEIDEIDELDEDVEAEAESAAHDRGSAGLEPVTHTQPIARPARSGQLDDEARVAPRRHSLTEEVISEGAQRSPEDGDFDFDKQLEEVRVLMKYHLFEHALGHAEQILRVAPHHQQGLELLAEILAALGRNQQAADARASLAQLLLDRDPNAAARHVELALALIPDHPLAIVLGEQLSEISGVDVGIADRQDALPSIDDPLGNLELDDDMLGPIEASDSLIGRVDRSLAHEIGSDYDHAAPPSESHGHIEIDDSVFGDGSDDIDIRSADPDLVGELNALGGDDEFAISVEQDTPEPEADELDFEDRFGLGGDEDEEHAGESEPEQEPEAGLEAGVPVGEIEDEVTGVYEQAPEPVLDDDTAVYEQRAQPKAQPEPEPEQDWPDLSAELEELEFYLAQDLEDDALAAFNDLVELFPGHPELAKLAPRFGVTLPEPEPSREPDAVSEPISVMSGPLDGVSGPVDAAEPLLDVEDEIADDEDDDDFLSSIFDEEAPRQRKEREVAIQTHEVEGADAGDHFDLGTAYREMGLVDKALAEYELAAKDPRWQAKALAMMGSLRAQTGDAPAAVELFTRAVAAARTKDERCESNYELAMALLALGRTDEAKQALEQVEPGYRDREARLAEIA